MGAKFRWWILVLVAALILGGCTVREETGLGIVARIVATPEEGRAPLTVQFDASASFDPHGALTDYLWDFGDGSPVVSGRELQHTYTKPGEYWVTLVVVGPSGTGRTSRLIRVWNNPPTAHFSFWPLDPFEDEPITFDGSSSVDPDGDLARWDWDFGDGFTAEGPIVTHAYELPGQYLVMLTVTDSAGAQAKASQLVTVEECSSGGCGRRR